MEGGILAGPWCAAVARLSDVKAEAVRWLWPGRIASGRITLVAGDPGVGKSTLALDLAARVTRGAEWPDGAQGAWKSGAGDVVLLTAEDDLADTVRPRLERAGADVGRVVAVRGVINRAINPVSAGAEEGNGETALMRAFELRRDLAALEEAMAAASDVRLVIIDPIGAYLGAGNTNSVADVHRVLSPLADLAARRGATVLAVTHLNKQPTSGIRGGGRYKAIYRTMGSVAVVAAARAAWLVAVDGEAAAASSSGETARGVAELAEGDAGIESGADSGAGGGARGAEGGARRRVMVALKNNLGPDVGGLAFSVEDGGVVWDPRPVMKTAEEVMRAAAWSSAAANAPAVGAEGKVERERVKGWLAEALREGPMPVKELMGEARAHGFGLMTVRRAKQELKIEVRKEGLFKGWCWHLEGTPEEREEGFGAGFGGPDVMEALLKRSMEGDDPMGLWKKS